MRPAHEDVMQQTKPNEASARESETRERVVQETEVVERTETEVRCRNCGQWFDEDRVAGVEIAGLPIVQAGNICEGCLASVFDIETDLSRSQTVKRSIGRQVAAEAALLSAVKGSLLKAGAALQSTVQAVKPPRVLMLTVIIGVVADIFGLMMTQEAMMWGVVIPVITVCLYKVVFLK